MADIVEHSYEKFYYIRPAIWTIDSTGSKAKRNIAKAYTNTDNWRGRYYQHGSQYGIPPLWN